jgi:hypothetical protein
LAAVRPIAVSIRLSAATRLSFSGPRIAFCTKFGPPWPTVSTRRLLASSICFCRFCSSRVTSAWADAGTAGIAPVASGQAMDCAASVPLLLLAASAATAPAVRAPALINPIQNKRRLACCGRACACDMSTSLLS